MNSTLKPLLVCRLCGDISRHNTYNLCPSCEDIQREQDFDGLWEEEIDHEYIAEERAERMERRYES